MTTKRLLLLQVVVVAAGLVIAADVARALDAGAEHEAIKYSTSVPTDPVARLQQQVDAGLQLEFDRRFGYLHSVLKALEIPVSSQSLVFSKTSLQVDHIGPWAPRALYFNEDVYVGWVQGAPLLEIASVDPTLGPVFYSLTQEASAAPRFAREGRTCLMCHDSSASTGGVPGLIVRSVLPDRLGYPVASLHDGATTDATPIGSRWGGWYATGTTAGQPHMGNVMSRAVVNEVGNVRQYMAQGTVKPADSLTSLHARFDTESYLSSHSDVVALMVLTHQAHLHNLITMAGYEARKAVHEERSRGGSGESAAYHERTLQRVKASAEPLVRAMFFDKEAPLPGRIEGTSSFAADFAARGPHDARGRSLRQLDLERRLFTYPLSYLIYSEPFNALPAVVKTYVYQRFREVLSGTDPNITHLSASDRQAIQEILEATKPDFRATY